MEHETTWAFTDDRGRVAASPHRPGTIVAYLPAGAALWDLGIRPVAVFGSAHDGAVPDPAKAGGLPLAETAYVGAGPGLDLDAVLKSDADLVVAVTYDGSGVYGIDPDAAAFLEARIPVVALSVGGGRPLPAIRGRFAELAEMLCGSAAPEAGGRLAEAEGRLRAAADAARGVRVVALSGAGPDTVHLARPHTWPDLAALAGFGVPLATPPEAGGVNWSSGGWEQAAGLRPDVVLGDVRAHASVWEDALAALGHRPAAAVPWNPELPPTAAAHARFFDQVAEALRVVRPGQPG